MNPTILYFENLKSFTYDNGISAEMPYRFWQAKYRTLRGVVSGNTFVQSAGNVPINDLRRYHSSVNFIYTLGPDGEFKTQEFNMCPGGEQRIKGKYRWTIRILDRYTIDMSDTMISQDILEIHWAWHGTERYDWWGAAQIPELIKNIDLRDSLGIKFYTFYNNLEPVAFIVTSFGELIFYRDIQFQVDSLSRQYSLLYYYVNTLRRNMGIGYGDKKWLKTKQRYVPDSKVFSFQNYYA